MKIGVIGAGGFLGRAVTEKLIKRGMNPIIIRRDTKYEELPALDFLINVAGNSKKYLADSNPRMDFEDNVLHVLRILTTIGLEIDKVVHISSSEVYGTMQIGERQRTELDKCLPGSNYGFSKMLTEQIIQNYAKKWIIFRLGGLFGDGMTKGPVFDILNNHPLRLTSDSTLQLMDIQMVANSLLDLVLDINADGIFNLATPDHLSIVEIGDLLNRNLVFSSELSIYHSRLDVSKISQFIEIDSQRSQLQEFVASLG